MAVTKKPYAIDAARVLYYKPTDPNAPYDREYPDAVWVPVVGHNLEVVSTADARNDAIRYVAMAHGSADGIDSEQGPFPDDGKVMPSVVGTVEGLPNEGATSEDEYLRAAALASARKGAHDSKDRKYVAFFRVRRLGLV